MATRGKIKRIRVQRYDKSGKLAAICSHGGYVGYTVLELSPNMGEITLIRNPKFVRSNTFAPTKYEIEIKEEEVRREGNKTTFSYRLIRVLAPEDTDLTRWTSTASLDELPVSPEEELTYEERAWAGERRGNLGGGLTLAIATIGTISLSISGYLRNSGYILFMFVTAVLGWFLVRYRWKVPKKALPEKLKELEAYKGRLRQQREGRRLAAVTSFENALKDFSNWEKLSPQNFEIAISMRLKRQGFKVKTTQYSNDGGIDIEATDDQGRPVIVQAKQYKNNVGVSVVREMIGVRESRPERPRTIIYSLVGFTRGARELAEAAGIELRDVKSELLHI